MNLSRNFIIDFCENFHVSQQNERKGLRIKSFDSGSPERWLCNPRVSGWISGAGNLEKLFIWMKIHGLTQKTNSNRVIEFVS